MEFKDTINLMCSKDYKERFVAEYWQTKIRCEKLKHLLNLMEAAYLTKDNIVQVIEPAHDCPVDLLQEQYAYMERYLHTLEVRALIECIDLEEVNNG